MLPPAIRFMIQAPAGLTPSVDLKKYFFRKSGYSFAKPDHVLGVSSREQVAGVKVCRQAEQSHR